MKEKSYRKKTGRPGRRKSLAAAIILLAGLILSPALTQITKAVDVEKACSLTVLPPSFGDDDIEGANIVIDLYKIADVEKVPNYDTYEFKVKDDRFSSVKDYLENMPSLDSNRYQMVANQAAKVVLADSDPTTNFGAITGDISKPIEGIPSGLYLMIPRGKDLSLKDYKKVAKDDPNTIVTTAHSDIYEYSFLPQLIALPNTAETIEPGQDIKTSDGTWKYDITATLKGERADRLGKFKIRKDLSGFETRQPATFVFSVDAYYPPDESNKDNLIYSNVVSVSFTSKDFDSENGAKGVKEVEFIPPLENNKEPADNQYIASLPVGTKVVVSEVYSGANYEKVNDPDPIFIKKLDEEVVSIPFNNEYGDTDKGTGAITNKFNYIEVTGKDGQKSHWGLKSIDDTGNQKVLVE